MSFIIKISTKIYLKIRVWGTENSKWKNTSIHYRKHEYLPHKKRRKNSNSNENMLFWRKTDEAIWKTYFLREPPPLPYF